MELLFTGCRPRQNCPSRHSLPRSHQYVQLNNVSQHPSNLIFVITHGSGCRGLVYLVLFEFGRQQYILAPVAYF